MPISGGRFFSVELNPSASDVLSVGKIGWTPASSTLRIGNPGENLFLPGTIRGRTDADFIISPGANGRTLKLGDSGLGYGTLMALAYNGGNTADGTNGNTITAYNILKAPFYRGTGGTLTLSGSTAKQPLRLEYGITGTTTYASQYLVDFRLNTDTADQDAVTGNFGILALRHNFGGGAHSGGRIPFLIELTQIGTTTGDNDYVLSAQRATIGYNMGGVEGTPAGRVYGGNFQLLIQNNATYLKVANMFGEANLRVKDSASVETIRGASLILLEGHTNPGTYKNIGVTLGAQHNVAKTWDLGYGFGTESGDWCLKDDASMFFAVLQTGCGGQGKIAPLRPQKAGWCLDFPYVTYASGYARGPGFSIGSTGDVNVANATLEKVSDGVALDVKRQIVTAIAISQPGQGSGSGVGNYFPGEPVFGPAGGRYMVVTTKVVAAAIVNAGSGGTTGTQTVTGTTGTGTKFQLTVTVSSGALSSIDAVAVQGSYTVNPTDAFDEPVSGGGLSGASVSLSIGIATFTIEVPDTSPDGATSYPNPVTLIGGSGAGATANLTWSANSTLKLNPTGQAIVFTPPDTMPTLANGEMSITVEDGSPVLYSRDGSGDLMSGPIIPDSQIYPYHDFSDAISNIAQQRPLQPFNIGSSAAFSAGYERFALCAWGFREPANYISVFVSTAVASSSAVIGVYTVSHDGQFISIHDRLVLDTSSTGFIEGALSTPMEGGRVFLISVFCDSAVTFMSMASSQATSPYLLGVLSSTGGGVAALYRMTTLSNAAPSTPIASAAMNGSAGSIPVVYARP